jgi:hypothetical protein
MNQFGDFLDFTPSKVGKSRTNTFGDAKCQYVIAKS